MLLESLLCLALNIYHEGRSQGYDGMAAVAVVTMNRAKQDPNQICAEVFRPKQFSWANSLTTVSAKLRKKRAKRFLPKDKKAWAAAKVVAKQALDGKLDSFIYAEIGTADHYFNPDKANPSWQHSMREVATIRNHVFYDSRG